MLVGGGAVLIAVLVAVAVAVFGLGGGDDAPTSTTGQPEGPSSEEGAPSSEEGVSDDAPGPASAVIPEAPTDVEAEAAPGRFAVSWTAVPAADAYEIIADDVPAVVPPSACVEDRCAAVVELPTNDPRQIEVAVRSLAGDEVSELAPAPAITLGIEPDPEPEAHEPGVIVIRQAPPTVPDGTGGTDGADGADDDGTADDDEGPVDEDGASDEDGTADDNEDGADDGEGAADEIADDEVIAQAGPRTIEFIETDDDEQAERLAEELTDEPDVVAASPNASIELAQAGDPESPRRTGVPAGFLRSGLPDELTGEGVTVAVVDSGVADQQFPLLDGATFLDTGDDRASTHATMVTGALIGNEESEIPGVAPNVRIASYDAGRNVFSVRGAITAIERAIDDGVDVIVLPWTTTRETTALQNTLDRAEQEGILVIAASGNHGPGDSCDRRFLIDQVVDGTEQRAPARHPNTLAVGASTRDGDIWECSVEGADVLAPGVAVRFMSRIEPGWWSFGDTEFAIGLTNGTSIAAPLTAGVAALLLQLDPTLSPTELRGVLSAAVDEDGVLDPRLAIALVDPDADAFTVTANHTRSTNPLYYSATAVVDGDRLVGSGQVYTEFSQVFPDTRVSCPIPGTRNERQTEELSMRRSFTVSGERTGTSEQGDDIYLLTFDLGAYSFPRQPSCVRRDQNNWTAQLEADDASIGTAQIEVAVGERDVREGDARAVIYEGRCEPIPSRIAGGCENTFWRERNEGVPRDPLIVGEP